MGRSGGRRRNVLGSSLATAALTLSLSSTSAMLLQQVTTTNKNTNLNNIVGVRAHAHAHRHTPAAAFTTQAHAHASALHAVNLKPYHSRRRRRRPTASRMFSSSQQAEMDGMETFSDVLPVEKGSHNSAKVTVPSFIDNDSDDNSDKDSGNGLAAFDKSTFRDKLGATVTACRELGKSSLWVEVPMSRAGLIEDMVEFGLRFHHTRDDVVVLNVWLLKSRDGDGDDDDDDHDGHDNASKIPEFATHNVGVGAVVVNSRDEILCVRELRHNYMPWKTPTGLSELGERIDEAAVREVLEETGIQTAFHSILGFRQTHGMAHGRSDLFFVCRLDLLLVDGETDTDHTDPVNGNIIIPTPIPQANEIEKAEWVPLSEYRAMVKGEDGSGSASSGGHPMMSHVMDILDGGRNCIDRALVHSIVPGRKSNHIYFPSAAVVGEKTA